MERDRTENTIETTVSAFDGDENFNVCEIDQALAFDNNDQEVRIKDEEGTSELSENELLELLDAAEEDSPQVLELMSSSQTLQSSSSSSIISVRNNVLRFANYLRQRRGKHPLRLDSRLTKAAQVHSEDMARHKTISHIGSDGSSFGIRIRRTGYRYRTAAENVAIGQKSSREVVKAWMQSPGHRRNILSSKYTEIGIGIVYAPKGPYWTQVFARDK
ncbi:MAG: CAP domain-containing protein [Cyanobacteria bacterium P01_H01_bin.21]